MASTDTTDILAAVCSAVGIDDDFSSLFGGMETEEASAKTTQNDVQYKQHYDRKVPFNTPAYSGNHIQAMNSIVSDTI